MTRAQEHWRSHGWSAPKDATVSGPTGEAIQVAEERQKRDYGPPPQPQTESK